MLFVQALILFEPTPSLTEFAFLQVLSNHSPTAAASAALAAVACNAAAVACNAAAALLAFEWQQLHQRIAFSKLVGLGMVSASIMPVGFSLWTCRRAGTPNPPYALQSLHHICTCKQQQQQQQQQRQQQQQKYRQRLVLAARGDPQSLCTEAAAPAAAAAAAAAAAWPHNLNELPLSGLLRARKQRRQHLLPL
ncbi:hypothetical protein Emag_005672 [Eimeria magna]